MVIERSGALTSNRAARRSRSLTSTLGLGEKLFASSDEKRFATAVEQGLEAVEAGLIDQISFHDELADTAGRYLLEAGGKRIRPTLTLLTAQLGDGNNDAVIAAAEAKPFNIMPTSVTPEVVTESYDQRHYRRARQYAANSNWADVVNELRDAIKLKSDKSEYHSLLGVAYLRQNMQGMARAHLKRALELNPSDPLVIKYAPQAGIVVPPPTPIQTPNGKKPPAKQTASAPQKRGGLFGFLRSGK